MEKKDNWVDPAYSLPIEGIPIMLINRFNCVSHSCYYPYNGHLWAMAYSLLPEPSNEPRKRWKYCPPLKIIILDIDGVVNVIPEEFDEFGGIWHSHFVDNLRTIIEQTGAKIVLSAGKRADGLSRLRQMWAFRNLPGEVIDVTPYCYPDKCDSSICMFNNIPGFEKAKRGREIQEWLDAHQGIDNYVIIDDDIDMLSTQMDNFVHCHGNNEHPDCVDDGYGLTKICAEKAISILNRE